MRDSIDYASPRTPRASATPSALAFVTKARSIFLRPRWRTTPGGIRIVPRPPGVVALFATLVAIVAGFATFAVIVSTRTSPVPARTVGVACCAAISALTVAGVAAVWIAGRRAHRRAADWLDLDRPTGRIALPAAGRTLAIDDVAAVELLTRAVGEGRDGELRLVLRSGECVGIVKTRSRRWARRLADECRATLREIDVDKRGHPTIWQTAAGGQRHRLLAVSSA